MAAAHLMPDEIPSPAVIATAEAPVIEVRGVKAGYGPKQDIIALEDINLQDCAG